MADACGDHGVGLDTRLDVDHLRSVAEIHLKEIAEEKRQEEVQEVRRSEEVECYTKHRQRRKEKRISPSSTTPTPKMRSAQDVLSRLQWDADHDIAKYTIGYLERFSGIQQMPASSWIAESTEEEWIPQHRIKYFKRTLDNGEQEVVWDREKRLDKVFGSGLSSTDEVGMKPEDGCGPSHA